MLSSCVVVWPTDEYHATHVCDSVLCLTQEGQDCLCPPVALCTYGLHSCSATTSLHVVHLFFCAHCRLILCFVSIVVWCLTPPLYPLSFPFIPPPLPSSFAQQALTTHTMFWRTALSTKPPHLQKVCSQCVCACCTSPFMHEIILFIT